MYICCGADEVFSIFTKDSFRNPIRVSNRLNPDQDILSVLIWDRTVCKDFQQIAKVGTYN